MSVERRSIRPSRTPARRDLRLELAAVVSTALAAVLVLAAHAFGLMLTPARLTALVLAPLVFLLWRRRPRFAPFALGPAVLAIVYTLVGLSGGPASSPIYPLVFVWIALVAGLLSPWAAVLTGALGAALELALVARGVLPLATQVAHTGFTTLFGALFGALLFAEVRHLKAKSDASLDEAFTRVEADARDFRLIGASLREGASRDPETTKRARQVGSVQAIRESLVDVLELARLSVKGDAAMLFVLDTSGATLKLKECVAAEGHRSIIEKPIAASEGALGAVVKTGRPVNLLPREGGRGLGYRTRTEVGSFLGVPVVEDGHVVGVLAVDRARPVAFEAADEELLETVARESSRTIEAERIFVAMDRVKYEQERLYEAFTLLSEALGVEKFAERLLDAASRVKKVDFSAVTLFDEESSTHRILAARHADASSTLAGASFQSKDGGLVVMALKNGHALPYVPLAEQAERQKLVLFGRLQHPALESVKVLPLFERGKGLGTLVVGSTAPAEELTREEERMLEVVTAHAAVMLANARMYEKMETMATTDGLTGLVNHRRFKELLEEALARATRFSRSVSVVMVDADHFKSVNDTYGHPVGDLVLRRIASVLKAEARRTDVVARYGGEEFIVVLDETDQAGAEMVAERIRAHIEREVIQGDFGRVRVTASLGVATWPVHAEVMADLLEKADQALYEAKRKGRNRVVAARTAAAHCAHPESAAIRVEEGAAENRPV